MKTNHEDTVIKYAMGTTPITRVKMAQDPMGGGGILPPPSMPVGDPMGGIGGGLGAPPMGGVPPVGAPPAGGPMPGAAPGGAKPDEGSKNVGLEDEVPEDLKESIKSKVKEKVEKKIQELTGQAPAEGEMGASGETGEIAPDLGAEPATEGDMPMGDEMPPAEGEMPSTEEIEGSVSGDKIEEFPTMISQMSDEQFEELFERAKAIFLGEKEKGGKEDKGSKKQSFDDKLNEGSELDAPEDLTVVADMSRHIIKKASDIVIGHMERDGNYWVSCPNTNIKSSIGIPRVHPISQCTNCPYYGDNGDNAGGNMAQIFCTYSVDIGSGGGGVRYIPVKTLESLTAHKDSTLPFGNLIKTPLDPDEKIFRNHASDVKRVKKIAKKETEYGTVENKQDEIWLKEGDAGEMVVSGTIYTLKRIGNDIEIYDGKERVDIIKGAINYTDQLLRENELIARMNKSPNMQTKFDNRRAHYDDLKKFKKFASETSDRQAFRKIVQSSSLQSDSDVQAFINILKDNGFNIMLTAEDKKWVKSILRRNANDITRVASHKEVKTKQTAGWFDEVVKEVW